MYFTFSNFSSSIKKGFATDIGHEIAVLNCTDELLNCEFVTNDVTMMNK